MAYKIAAASSDGVYIDLSFGAADSFYIYEIDEENQYHFCEIRKYTENAGTDFTSYQEACHDTGCSGIAGNREGCQGTGCNGQNKSPMKIALIEDCRCILCKKLGFQVQKQLEKKAITAFAIDLKIDDAIRKIAEYFDRVDHHKNLRGIAGQG